MLLVDDEKLLRFPIGEAQLQDSFDVLSAADCAKDLRLAHSRLCLALLGRVLPDGTGAEVLGVIREHGLERRAIVMTVVFCETKEAAALAAGADRFVEKPSDVVELGDTVRDCPRNSCPDRNRGIVRCRQRSSA